MSDGMKFSVAVLLHGQDGNLIAKVPPEVAEQLGVDEGDVLCWTGFENGPVEVWSVKKSPYSSLNVEEG